MIESYCRHASKIEISCIQNVYGIVYRSVLKEWSLRMFTDIICFLTVALLKLQKKLENPILPILPGPFVDNL